MHLFILYGHADDLPTHGFLINLLHKAEQKSEIKNANLSAILLADFKLFYPHIQIGRADRFLDTVRRIATPTMGPNKITGSSLRSYLKRTWTPRIRNQNGIPCTYTHEHACTIIKMTYSYTDIYLILIIISTAATYSQFPAYLHEYGLCEDVLLTTFEQTKQPNSTFLSWSLCQHPTVNFYIHLHNFLKLCSVTKNETKATIGKFYNAIDPFLRKKMMRPDNIYQLVENRVKYTKNTTTLMNYSFSRKSITTSVSTLADAIPEQPDCDSAVLSQSLPEPASDSAEALALQLPDSRHEFDFSDDYLRPAAAFEECDSFLERDPNKETMLEQERTINLLKQQLQTTRAALQSHRISTTC